ncbi:MAG: di-trans,poly-cis-decaprenylcistransferase [Bryobacterales bacterium]|nr:di-trans,poly-cis-decaprenylcistransferase [Bryobacterales bacterium]
MDGNGRWAEMRGLPRITGHQRGAEAVRTAVEAAPAVGITDLTLYAFSSDNWKRPAAEVSALMKLLAAYLESEAAACARKGVRLSVIGRRDRLSAGLRRLIESTERLTAPGERVHVRLAIDYSSRDTLLRAAEACSGRELTREALAAHLPAPDVDLLIRTAGEQRLSDFLLWECAYAEFVFTDLMWPDFTAEDLGAAINVFHSRNRRFGGLPPYTFQSGATGARDHHEATRS